MTKPKAVVLLSGGLDSCVTLSLALRKGYECYPLSFDYNQRHSCELDSAKSIAAHYNLRHKIVSVALDEITINSSLTNKDMLVDLDEDPYRAGIPSTWVPQRNSLFLAYAFAYAETIGASAVFIGANQVDYSGYPDCRLDFITQMELALNYASKKFVEDNDVTVIHTPLISLTKAKIIDIGLQNDAPLHLTHSCYSGTVPACGECDSCQIRLEAFKNLGVKDPILYR